MKDYLTGRGLMKARNDWFWLYRAIQLLSENHHMARILQHWEGHGLLAVYKTLVAIHLLYNHNAWQLYPSG